MEDVELNSRGELLQYYVEFFELFARVCANFQIYM